MADTKKTPAKKAEADEPTSELREVFVAVVKEGNAIIDRPEADNYDDAVLVGLGVLKNGNGESFSIMKRYELA